MTGSANDRLETTCQTGAANDPSPVEPEECSLRCFRLVEQSLGGAANDPSPVKPEQQWTAWRQPKLTTPICLEPTSMELEQQPKDPFLAGSFCGMVLPWYAIDRDQFKDRFPMIWHHCPGWDILVVEG